MGNINTAYNFCKSAIRGGSGNASPAQQMQELVRQALPGGLRAGQGMHPQPRWGVGKLREERTVYRFAAKKGNQAAEQSHVHPRPSDLDRAYGD